MWGSEVLMNTKNEHNSILLWKLSPKWLYMNTFLYIIAYLTSIFALETYLNYANCVNTNETCWVLSKNDIKAGKYISH